MKKFFPALILFFFVFSFTFILAAPGALAVCNCVCNGGTSGGPQPDQAACETVCGQKGAGFLPASCITIQQSNNTGGQSGQVVLTDPLSLGGDPTKFFGRLIGALLAFVGVASLITFVYAGFMFLTSTGNQEQVKKAKDTMIYAVIGAAVSMGSYAILSYVFDILQKSAGQ